MTLISIFLKIIILIILIILTAFLLLFPIKITTIEKFTGMEDIKQLNIYNISCGKSKNNLDNICNIYITQKNYISKFEHEYNSAKRNTQSKYELLNFAKNEVAFKKSALDTAIILNSKINIRNKIERTLNIINAVVAAKKLVMVLNNGYSPSTIIYKNALEEYNKTVAIGNNNGNYNRDSDGNDDENGNGNGNSNDNGNSNEKILEINENGGYSSPFEALKDTIDKYNNAVFIAIATNTSKSKNLTPSISKTTEIDDLMKAQTAANDAFNEMNDKYIIPSLNSYNQIAKDANMKQYEITNNLSFIQINAEIAYKNAIKSEKTLIGLASANYQTAINEEVEKIILFYNAIKDLQTAFNNYCHLLINPEISYKSSSNNDNEDEDDNVDNNVYDNGNNNDDNYCDRYEKLNNDLYKALPEFNKINDEISKLKEISMKTFEYDKIEETKNNVKLIFDYLEKSYFIKLDDYKNKIIKNTDDFLNKYIDLNTANNLYYKYVISYNQTPEKQEYNKKVIDTLPTIQNYDNIKNNIKRCYPDG